MVLFVSCPHNTGSKAFALDASVSLVKFSARLISRTICTISDRYIYRINCLAIDGRLREKLNQKQLSPWHYCLAFLLMDPVTVKQRKVAKTKFKIQWKLMNQILNTHTNIFIFSKTVQPPLPRRKINWNILSPPPTQSSPHPPVL